MKKNSFVVGTLVTYIALLLTKILGAVYVIPFYKIIGETGGILYGYAYNVYNLFLTISTSGIPVAVSIIIAEYNALRMFKERDYTYKIANRLIATISFTVFLIMFIFAGSIAKFFIGDIDSSITIESIKLAIRSVSLCLLIVPFLSVVRGYLQGNRFISPSSISQLVEQVVRIVVALVGSYVIINVLHLDISIGVAVALLGAFFGALVAFGFLKWKIWKNKEQFEKPEVDEPLKVSAKEVIKKIVKHAVPIIIIAVTQNIYEIVDLKCILKGLTLIGYDAEKTQLLGSVIITWSPKICMIINSLAIGLCSSIIPFVVNSYVNKDNNGLNNKFNQAINTIIFITIPLAAFMIAFGKEIYYIFYGESQYGGNVLGLLSIVSIFFSVQMVMNMMLQGMKKYRIVYLNSIVGIVVNALLDIPMILLLNKLNFYPYLGSLMATIIGQTVSITIIVMSLNKEFSFDYKPIATTIFKTLLATLVMTLLLFLLKMYVPFAEGYFMILCQLALFGAICFGLYLLVAYKQKTVFEVFGENFFEKILSKFRKKDQSKKIKD